jgi:ADP-glucose pyrophosphorylase
MPAGHTRYEHRRQRVYVGRPVDLARYAPYDSQVPFLRSLTACLSRTCEVRTLSLVGHGAQVGPETVIDRSVIGNGCIIGADCTIEDSFIFKGARIEDGCTIRHSIVGAGTTIGSESELSRGTLIGASAVVGRNARLRGERVSVEQWLGHPQDESVLKREWHHGMFLWLAQIRLHALPQF